MPSRVCDDPTPFRLRPNFIFSPNTNGLTRRRSVKDLWKRPLLLGFHARTITQGWDFAYRTRIVSWNRFWALFLLILGQRDLLQLFLQMQHRFLQILWKSAWELKKIPVFLYRELEGQSKAKWNVILALTIAQKLLCNFLFFLQKNATACKNSEKLKTIVYGFAQGTLNTFHIWE